MARADPVRIAYKIGRQQKVPFEIGGMGCRAGGIILLALLKPLLVSRWKVTSVLLVLGFPVTRCSALPQ